MPDETRSAEYLRGAREALTRLAEDRDRDSGRTCNGGYIRHFRDRVYPAPRVRATVPDSWRQGKWELYRGEWLYSGVMPLKTPVFPSCEEVAGMYALQQRADAEGFVSAEEGLGGDDKSRPNGESPTRRRDHA